MLQCRIVSTTLLGIALILSAVSMAQTSGLSDAPSMKTRRHGQLTFQYRQTSRDSALDSRYRKNLQILFGAMEGLEIGFTSNLDGQSGFGAKYSFLAIPEERIRFAIGGTDLDTDPEIFFGAVKDFDDFELHAGFIDANKGQGFIGYRTRLSEELRFTADHVTGNEGSVNFRFDYDFAPSWSFDTRIYFPLQSGSPRTHRFGVQYQVMIDVK